MNDDYLPLQEAFDRYRSGGLTDETLKPITAPFGIYQQRNEAFMVRVRITGGEIPCEKLAGLADVLERAGGYAHLTSRQDIQLHDLPAERVMDVVNACDAIGWPFKGGGGNTYRNMLVGADSGLSLDTVFDVYPYATAVNRALQTCEKAYSLPRKLKIGFFASDRDLLRAAVQDMGFVARVRDGKRGFHVYAGGGLGRDSAVGVILTDFLPVERTLQAVFALVSLFHEHGDRTNRHQARLRFLLRRLGREAFIRLFGDYFERTEAPPLCVGEETRLPAGFTAHQESRDGADAEAPDSDYSRWESFAVSPTRFGDTVTSVRLFVPYGNLTAAQLRRIAVWATDAGSPFVRVLPAQDLLIPFVRRASLPDLFARIRRELPEMDLTFTSFKGHLVTCVGASVCKIGMVNAPAVADRLAEALDRYLPPDTPEKRVLLKWVADDLRISGCPNSCAGHPAAKIGIGCINQKIEGDVVPFARMFVGAGVTEGVPHLSVESESVPMAPVSKAVDDIVSACLKAVGQTP